MTDARIIEINKAGRDIIDMAADLQTALHPDVIGEERSEQVMEKLQGIKELAGTFRRINGNRLDPAMKMRIICQNSLSSLRQQLDNIYGDDSLDELSLYRLGLQLEKAEQMVRQYLNMISRETA